MLRDVVRRRRRRRRIAIDRGSPGKGVQTPSWFLQENRAARPQGPPNLKANRQPVHHRARYRTPQFGLAAEFPHHPFAGYRRGGSAMHRRWKPERVGAQEKYYFSL